ncbi:AraC family transcriptional regulator [Maribacter sp. X9]|uniref:AraC family transcriptional regulator n=1 Tax=Maribacter sp. X9 TaxID=3402159 RepID=UPI003AF3678C
MKVLPFKIPKPVDEQLIVQIDKEPIFYNRLHQHEEIQISHIINGSGKLLVGDSIHQFSKGDTYIIGSNLPHIFKSVPGADDAHMVTVFFTENTFGPAFFNMACFEKLQAFFSNSITGFKATSTDKDIGKMMLKLSEQEKLERFITFLKLLELLSQVDSEPLTKFIYSKSLTSNEGERLQVIFDFVFKNFHKSISLEEISNMAYMTPNAFCRFFKQRTNKTFFQFLIELRIEHACQLLKSKKELNINLVSDRSGFNSISNFNKKFKKIKGMSPSEYQQYLDRR